MATYQDGLNTYYLYNGQGPLTCPVGWIPVWNHNATEGVLDRPEFKQAGVPQTRTPEGAAAIHSSYSTSDGALVRTFNVGVGEEITASVHMMKVAEEGGAACVLGIDPTGQTLIDDDRIVWSRWLSMHAEDWKANEYAYRQVSAIAQSNQITVFLRHKSDFKQPAHSHFDDFTLTTSGVVPPDPPDPPEPPSGTLGELIGALEQDVIALSDYVADAQVMALVVG
jgi:hypothetical protein